MQCCCIGLHGDHALSRNCEPPDVNFQQYLDGESVLIDGDLFYMFAAAYAHLLFGYQVLNDHVGDQLPERVAVMIKTVDGREHQLIHCDVAAVRALGRGPPKVGHVIVIVIE